MLQAAFLLSVQHLLLHSFSVHHVLKRVGGRGTVKLLRLHSMK